MIFILPACLYGQNDDIKFIHLYEGLSQSTITAILQDEMGFMWFGTRGGLNKYDGSEFTIYENVFNDSTSLSHNWIRSMIEDSEGNQWIGTADGLSLLDRDTNKFIQFVHNQNDKDSLSHNIVNAILEDSKGNLWVGTDQGGLNLLNRQKDGFIRFQRDDNDSKSISSNTIHCLYEDRNQNIWIGTGDGLLNLFNRNDQSFTQFDFDNGGTRRLIPGRFRNILEDHQGRLWIGTQGTGLLSIESYSAGHIQLVQYVHNKNDENSLSNNNILSMCLDKSNNLWIGTENSGLDILNLQTKTFKHYKSDPGDETSISSNSIWSINQDEIGRMWIGTFDRGLNIIDKYYEKFTTYKHLKSDNSLSHDNVAKFLEDESGNLWIATDGGGLNYFNRNKKLFIHYRHNKYDKNSLSSDAAISLYEDSRGNLWIGTWAGGINVLDKDKKTFRHYNTDNSSLNCDNVHDIIDDKDGYILVATNPGGLNIYDPRKKRFYCYTHDESDINSLSSNRIIQLFRDRKGSIWIGTEGSGLDLLNKNESGQISFVHYQHNPTDPHSLSNNIVESIYEDSHNNLWIGTSNGLNLMDRKKGTFKIFYKEDGLPSNMIRGILEDNQGCLWISTIKGLSQFDPRTKTFKNYNVSDGLQGNEFNGKDAAYRSRTGELFFGGSQGFNVFYPEKIIENPFISPVYITNFEIFNKPVSIGTEGSPIQKHITKTNKIVLSYKQSVFSFEFVALNYTHPEKNQYAYMMEGFEKNWNYVGSKRSATYTNLDPGKYLFRVRGSNNDDVWNEEGVALAITITPPYWQTWWFRGSGILLVLVLIGTVYKVRTRTIRERAKQLEKQVAARTAELELSNERLESVNNELKDFAYIVSHDLKAPLRAVHQLAGWISQDYSDVLDEEGKKQMNLLLSRVQRMDNLINGVLQYSRAGRIKGKEELINLNSSLKDVIESISPPENIYVTVEDNFPTICADRVKIEQVFQNLISNAVKYMDKSEGEIRIRFVDEGSHWKFSVADNGPGIDEKHHQKIFQIFQTLESRDKRESTGVGLSVVKKIIGFFGGKIWVESEVSKGSTFFFTFPKKETR